MAKYHYSIKLDKAKDAWNWYSGCNCASYGVDWGERVSPEIYSRINGESEEDAYEYINIMLSQKYKLEKTKIMMFKQHLHEEYRNKFLKACRVIETITNRPLCRQDFTIFITTFPRGPYNIREGYIWEYYGWDNPIPGFIHEALHFQFTHYWGNDPSSKVSKLNDEAFHFIKESLTVILDEDLYPLIAVPDKGYDIHQNFRKELHKFWKDSKDFDKLVEFSLKEFSKYSSGSNKGTT